MKIWLQEMLPLTILKDLGPIYRTENSSKKARYMEFECPICKGGFEAPPSKVKSGVILNCPACSLAKVRSTPIDNTTGVKECSTCKKELKAESFYKNKRRHDCLDSRCKHCMDKAKSDWVQKNPDKVKEVSTNNRLLSRYGITLTEYNQLVAFQNNRCKICGNEASNGRSWSTKLSVDHCHSTGKIRGLLCQKCNTGLGLFGDTIENLKKALEYLENN